MNSNVWDTAEKLYSEQKSQPNELIQKNPENPFDIAESQLSQKFPFENENDIERDVDRSQAQITSRAIEGVAGLPGDLINFAAGLFGYDPKIPGSDKLKELSEKASQGYTRPQNEFEEKMGDVVKDISLFALPGAQYYGLARNLGIPVVANLAKEGLKQAGVGETKQDAAKIGSMVLLDLLGHRAHLGTAKEFAGSLFQKADQAIPKGLSISSTNLEKSLNSLENSLKLGGERPSTGDALKKIAEIKNEIKNGKIDLKSLVSYRPSINEWIDKYKGFDINVPPSVKDKIVKNLNEVKGQVIKAAHEYGEKYNPEYLNLSKSANEAYAAYAQSNKIKNFIEKHAASKLQSTAAKVLLGAAGSASTGLSALGGLTGLAGTTTSLGAYKIFKTILRSKSPALRNHYLKIIEGASKGNAGQVIKNAKALDKGLLDMDQTGEINTLE